MCKKREAPRNQEARARKHQAHKQASNGRHAGGQEAPRERNQPRQDDKRENAERTPNSPKRTEGEPTQEGRGGKTPPDHTARNPEGEDTPKEGSATAKNERNTGAKPARATPADKAPARPAAHNAPRTAERNGQPGNEARAKATGQDPPSTDDTNAGEESNNTEPQHEEDKVPAPQATPKRPPTRYQITPGFYTC